MKRASLFIKKFLHNPYYVLIFCLIFLGVNLVADKTIIQFFQLNRDLNIVQNRIQDLEKKNKKLKINIQKASDPEFVEREARERLDYINQGDLIFIFPDEI